MSQKDTVKYWNWFFKGSGGKAGFRRLVNRWLIFHLFVGCGVALVVPIDLKTASNAVLMPIIGILIGLSFAWAGNAQALMQSTEIEGMTKFHRGGFVEYVFVYQTAILAILVTVILWGLAGLSVFDSTWPKVNCIYYYFGVKIVLYTLCSLTLRECWHVILGAQWMLLSQREIKKQTKK